MEVIAGAVIALLGGIITALIARAQQRESTRALVASELSKLTHQQSLQSKWHVRSRKEERLLQFIPSLLAASDPELHADFNYPEVVMLIHKIQVTLIPRDPLERAVNDAVGKLGLAVQAAKCGQGSSNELLSAQDTLVRVTRALLDAP